MITRRLLDALASSLTHPGTNNAILRGGSAVVILNPEHAAVFEQANLSREAVQRGLYERCRYDGAELNARAGGFAVGGDDETQYDCFERPEDILVLIAGGVGLYSMVMSTWCAGAHRNTFVSVPVELDQFCEVPGAAGPD